MASPEQQARALIGSPYQLLTLLEAVAAGVVPAPAVVLQGAPLQYSPLLSASTGMLAETRLLQDSTPARVIGELRRASPLIIGDLYSRLGHMVLALRNHHDRLVALEDGAAMVRGLRSLTHGRPPLARAHARRQRTPAAGLARRRLASMLSEMTVVGALPVAPEVASRLRRCGTLHYRHRFEWTRDRWPARSDGARAGPLVLGSSLAADGIVQPRAYLGWLDENLSLPGATFRPHRRDLPDALSLVADRRVPMSTDPLPVEALLAASRPAEIITLPSTAALTARVLAPRMVVRCWRVPTAWLDSRATKAMVELLNEVAALSVLPPR